MENILKSPLKSLLILLLIIGLISCGDDEETSQNLTCPEDAGTCLTNGSRQAYFPFISNGVENMDDCILSIRMSFGSDGSFSFSSNSGCENIVQVANYTGNWTFNNDETQIRITPPFFPATSSVTVLEIISLDGENLVAKTPSPGGLFNITWKRL